MNRATIGILAAFVVHASNVRAQALTVPLSADAWTASDSVRAETFLGRPSLYINKGAAIARGIELRNGTIEFDMAATERTNFIGVSFHARSPDNSEVVFFRFNSSGNSEAVQYAPALNSVAAAWQIYHGDGANAVAQLVRGQWMHVKIDIAGDVATLYLEHAEKPTLVIPRLAGVDGSGIGVWAGGFGKGAYVSNITYTPDRRTLPAQATPPLPAGTLADWQLSQALDATTQKQATLPDLKALQWQSVHAEPPGIVLINRYRRQPAAGPPADPTTHEILVDSIMNGRVAGTQVVYARTEIQADRDELRRMHIGYSDGVVVYVNGTPLFVGMRPAFWHDLAIFEQDGTAVYLPLKKGRNDIVLAITEYTGGWAFSARLDPLPN